MRSAIWYELPEDVVGWLPALVASSVGSNSMRLVYGATDGCDRTSPGRAGGSVPAEAAAGVAELADALDLGSSDANRGGSSPPARTTAQPPGDELVIIGFIPCK